MAATATKPSWQSHKYVSAADVEEARRVVADAGFEFDPSADFLGQGRYALVFKATKKATSPSLHAAASDDAAAAEVAVKFCSIKKLGQFPEAVKRLRNEVDLHSRLRHPNIVRLFNHFETPSGVIALVMEKCDCSLLDVVGEDIYNGGRGTPLPEKTARVYARQIASALDYLSGFDIAHRDMSLTNIFCVKSSDHAAPFVMKLADFGLSKEQPQSFIMSTDVGTPYFKAPEIVQKQPYLIASDIWSLGTLIYAMLTGRNVVGEVQRPEDLPAWFKAHESVELPANECSCSAECRDFIARCLQRDPTRRINHSQLLSHPWLRFESTEQSIALVMQNRSHPNVMQFNITATATAAATAADVPSGRVTEILLTSNPEELVTIALSCANGMAFLASRGVVHRALRASNLLFVRQDDRSISYKAGGFDLLQLMHNGRCIVDPSPCPVKWTAPEALRIGEFTEKSDVWSFGVVLWELFSRSAEEPFGISELTRDQMLAKLDAGDRLVLPSGCDPRIAALMESCFAANPADRPTFEQISKQLRDVSASFVPQQHFPDQTTYLHAKLSPLPPGTRVDLEATSSTRIAAEVLANAEAWWKSVFGAVQEVSWASFSEMFGPAPKEAFKLLLKPIKQGTVAEPVVPLAHWKIFMLNFHIRTLSFGQIPSSAIDFQLAAEVATSPHFRGFIGGNDAIGMLKGKQPGSCLLRITTSPTASSKGWLTLSFVASSHQVVNLVIGRHAPDERTIGFCNRQQDHKLPQDFIYRQFYFDANAPDGSQPFSIPVYASLGELLQAVEDKHGFKLCSNK